MDIQAQRIALCSELVQDVARGRGKVLLKLTGTSMLPSMRPGDVVTVQRCELTQFRATQIVLYRREGRLIAHRVRRVAHDHLITRGDSVPVNDPPVTECEIAGRIVEILRDGRAIPLEASIWNRAVSWILRRSDIGTRYFLIAANITERFRLTRSATSNPRFRRAWSR